jgi:hypothetical protein
MSRILVLPDSAHPQLEGCPLLMDEEVQPEHLQDGHSANQLLERVAWAVCDASECDLRGPGRSSKSVLRRESLATPQGRIAK